MWRDGFYHIWQSVSNTERVNVWCFVFSLAAFCCTICVLFMLKLIRWEIIHLRNELLPQDLARRFKRQSLNG